jgi:glucose/arabinose dehydrogenase
MRTPAVAFAVSLAALPLAGQTVDDPALHLQLVTGGLSLPTSMAFVSPADILVLQKNDGKVRRVRNGVLLPGAVLDFPVNADSERGLLGIAVSRDDPPYVYIYLTEAAVDGGAPIANRVYRFVWNAGPGTLTNRQLVLDLPATPGPNHDGGALTLDPQGRLYAVIGDLNRSGQLQNHADAAPPDDTSVIFRVNPDGSAAAGNPFTPYCSATTTRTCTSSGGCPGGETCRTQVARYYAYGVRNSFGLAIDPVTGTLWDTENGPSDYDEVNRVLPGFNSGWNQIQGPNSRDPQDVPDLFDMPGAGSTYSDPEFSWVSTIAPTAILFPRGLGAGYDRAALVSDSNKGAIYRFPLNAARTAFDLSGIPGLADLVADDADERNALRIGSGFSGITDLEEGPDGFVYVVSINQGAIYRISGPGRDYHTVTPCRLVDTRTTSPLVSGVERLVSVTGTCGIPATARAVAVNVAVTAPTGTGNVTLYAANAARPVASAINFPVGRTRSSNTIVALSSDGLGRIKARASVAAGGTTHLILDVAGYFE